MDSQKLIDAIKNENKHQDEELSKKLTKSTKELNDQIAKFLRITVNTVKFHSKNIFKKFL